MLTRHARPTHVGRAERLHSRKQLLGHLSSVGGAEDALNVVDVVRLVGEVFGYLRHCDTPTSYTC